MSNFNALAAVADALKVSPETVSFPERLEGADLVALADARSRLQQIGQAANELRRLVDRELAAQLGDGALRYGDTLIRVSGRGTARIIDRGLWWDMVTEGLAKSDDPAGLLASLYSADNVKVTGLDRLAQVLDIPESSIRSTMLDYDPPTSPLSFMPVSKVKWAQGLGDGEVSVRQKHGSVDSG